MYGFKFLDAWRHRENVIAICQAIWENRFSSWCLKHPFQNKKHIILILVCIPETQTTRVLIGKDLVVEPKNQCVPGYNRYLLNNQPTIQSSFYPQTCKGELEEAVKVMDKIIIQVATWGCKCYNWIIGTTTWRIIPSGKWLMTMVMLLPFQMVVSWPVLGGGPNYTY